MSDKWDLDRVERAAKAEGLVVSRGRGDAFTHVEPGVRFFANGDVLMLAAHVDITRKAVAAYDAIVARMARELPAGWRDSLQPDDYRHNWFADQTPGTPSVYVDRNPAAYPEAAKALRELADWLERQVKP